MSETKANLRHYDIIRMPHQTEKTYGMLTEQNKVVFFVASDANKVEVKDAVEAIFDVGVTAVNIVNQKGKEKRFRGRKGKRSDFKKAIVTLKEGDNIEAISGA